MPRPVPPILVSPAHAEDRPLSVERLTRLLQGDVLHRPVTSAEDVRPGLTFSVQDHLGLASHPTLRTAALSNPHTATDDSDTIPLIESRLAAALRLPGAVTFASGSDAIRQTFSTVLTPHDHVLIDSAAPLGMFDAAQASGATLQRFPAASLDAVERRLLRLSRQPRHGRLVIAIPALSAFSSRIWDLAELSALSRAHGALLIVDASLDLGTMGPDGGGVMELQRCLGRADIVLGSLATCFGAQGGFAAFRDSDLLPALRRQAIHLSPESARVILAATDLAFSAEGTHRRRLLHHMSLRLRNHLMADGAPVLGNASPLVPVLLPARSALQRAAMLESAGPRVTLLQAPTVPRHAPRWRIELSALHSLADIDDLAELICDVSRAFDRPPARLVAV
jgi:7-keto-8-aminopelargonate synthetase-like enzyme